MSPDNTWDISRPKRECHATGQELTEGMTFYTALREDGETFLREDYSLEAWEAVDRAPFFSYWKGRIQPASARRDTRLVIDTEAFYAFFRDLGESDKPHRQLFRYLVALLLVRKRVLRLDEIEKTPDGETLLLFDNRAKEELRVFSPPATPEQLEEAEAELNQIFECRIGET